MGIKPPHEMYEKSLRNVAQGLCETVNLKPGRQVNGLVYWSNYPMSIYSDETSLYRHVSDQLVECRLATT